MVFKTYHPSAMDRRQIWYLADADGKNLGRLASRVAHILLGKDRPDYTPGFASGNHVVVINAARVAVTGKKLDEKIYQRHSGYPGGFRETTLRTMLARAPERVLREAVWGMIPHNRFGRQLMRNLKIYGGADHPHRAQNPGQLP
jgi:large subunit ribosomal protein L13